mmetsp:Transcript_118894/g.371743  ORF Transcript_118894/g.371743 Transcript_118894/m.371743 type:complete len:237 (+) Transcript_118894:237-947(+)
MATAAPHTDAASGPGHCGPELSDGGQHLLLLPLERAQPLARLAHQGLEAAPQRGCSPACRSIAGGRRRCPRHGWRRHGQRDRRRRTSATAGRSAPRRKRLDAAQTLGEVARGPADSLQQLLLQRCYVDLQHEGSDVVLGAADAHARLEELREGDTLPARKAEHPEEEIARHIGLDLEGLKDALQALAIKQLSKLVGVERSVLVDVVCGEQRDECVTKMFGVARKVHEGFIFHLFAS